MDAKQLEAWIGAAFSGVLADEDWCGVMPWQRQCLEALWPAGRRGPSVAAISLARGNGKTKFLSVLAFAAWAGPIKGQDVLVVAPSAEAGGLVFGDLARWTRRAFPLEVQRREVLLSEAPGRLRLRHPLSGLTVRVVGAKASKLLGARFGLALVDEPLAIGAAGSTGTAAATARANEVWAALLTSQGKAPPEARSRIIVAGTRPPPTAAEDHFFTRLLDSADRGSGTVALDWSAAKGKPGPWDAPHMIHRANPSLRTGGRRFDPLRQAIYRERAAARRDEALRPAYEAYRLNMPRASVDDLDLVDVDLWRRTEVDGEAWGAILDRREGVVFGVDLGANVAMTAVAAAWPSPDGLTLHADAIAGVSAVPDLLQRGHQDAVGDLYRRLADRGELVVTPGRVVAAGEVLRAAVARWGMPEVVVCDAWRLGETQDAMSEAGIWAPVVVRRAVWKDATEDVRGFRMAVLSGLLRRAPSLLLDAAITGARVVPDGSGNLRLARRAEAGRQYRHRDDAAQAVMVAASYVGRHLGVGASVPARS